MTKSRDIPTNLDHFFTSEALLQQAIAGLLSRLPGIDGVQILHGPTEFGKDIIFRCKGAFGEPLLCACVVKKDGLTGNVASNQGARTIFHQVEQALDTPFIDEFGEAKQAQRAYVVTPQKISQTTMLSISGALKQRAGQIVFISGHELLRLFQKHWPDFLADEAQAISRYLKSITSGLQQYPEISRLSMLYDLDQSATSSNFSVYVDLNFETRFHEIQFDTYPSTLIPTRNRLKEGWAKRDFPVVKGELEVVARLCAYLDECNMWPSNETFKSADITTLIDELNEMLPTAWSEFAVKHLGRKGEIPQLASGALLKLERQKELQEICDKLRERTILIINHFQEVVSVHIKYIEEASRGWKTAVGLLNNSEFRQALYLENCIQFFPYYGVRKISKMAFTLSKNELFGLVSPILVTGPAGSGKTSFCRWNALRDIEAFTLGESPWVPVYVALHSAPIEVVSDIWELLEISAKTSALLDEQIVRDFQKNNLPVRVYLDGLDEVFMESSRKRLAEIVKALSTHNETNRKIQIIITSRDYIGGAWLNWLPRVSLESIGSEQLRELAEKWLGGKSELTDEFFRQLQNFREVESICKTPLLATITLMVFKQTHQLPSKRTRLYELFIDLLSGGWDVAKGVIRESKFSRDAKVRVLSCLAYNVHKMGLRKFGEKELRDAIVWEFESLDSGLWKEMVNELVRNGVIGAEGIEYQFRHLSFQEYLAARHCVNKPRDLKIRHAVKSFNNGENWWREVIRFYVGITGSPKEFFRWLNTFQGDKRREELQDLFTEEDQDISYMSNVKGNNN